MPLSGPQLRQRPLQHLEVSAATIAQRHLTPQRLADAIHTAVTHHQLRSNTQQLANLIHQEDGTAAVLATVDALLNQTTT